MFTDIFHEHINFSSFIPDVVLLVFCNVVGNAVTSGNDNPHHPHLF